MGTKRTRKNPAAVALGKRSAQLRRERLTLEERQALARRAAAARWRKERARRP